MPVISTLLSGIPLNSTGNLRMPGEVTITDPNGFFPIYNAQGQLQSGGMFATMYVQSGIPGTISTLVTGQALTLSIEYNNSGQFRYDVFPRGGTTLSSPFYPINSEHSVGVSYDTTSGLTILSVDGLSQSAYSSYTTSGTSPLAVGQTIGSSLLGSTSNPATFNGYLDQVALFGVAPTAGALNVLTNDPLAANTAFFTAQSSGSNPIGHIESQAVTYATISQAEYAAASGVLVLSETSFNGIGFGDIVTDATTPLATANGLTLTQIGTTNNNTVVWVTLSGALTAPVAANDVLIFTHPSTTRATSTLVSGATQTINIGAATGVMAGDTVSGFNIPANTTVSNVTGAGSVSLSASPSNTGLSSALTFTHPAVPSNVTFTALSTTTAVATLTLPSTVNVQVGDVLIGTGVPSYDHIIGINGSSVNLSQVATVTTGNSYTLVHSTLASSTATSVLTAGVVPAVISIVTTATGSVGLVQVGDIVMDVTNPSRFVNETVLRYDPSGSVTLSSPAAVTRVAADNLIFTHTTITSTTGSAGSASTSISLTSGLGVQVGDIVVDVTNNSNTVNSLGGITVTAVSGNLVTLSAALASSFTNDALNFIHPPIATVAATATSAYVPSTIAGTANITTGYQTTAGSSFMVYSLAGIQAGDLVFGPGIPAGDTVSSTWVPSLTSSSVTLTASTTTAIPNNSTLQFVHQNNPNIQLIALNSTSTAAGTTAYKSGDVLSVTAYLNASTPVTRSYTVASSDIGTSPAATEANIAASFVLANPTIGSYYVIKGPPSTTTGYIELVPMNGAQMPLPTATVTDVTSAGVDVNTVSQFYNFYKSTTSASSFTGAANGTARANLTDSTGTNSPSAVSVSYATSGSASAATKQAHGPIFAEIASISGTLVTYNLFVDPSLVPGPTLNSVGVTINVPTTQATINNILPGAGGTVTQVNTAVSGAITYQWLSNLGVTDFTKPIAQLQLTLANPGTNIINATMTNMSVNSTNFKDPVQNVPMLTGTDLNSQVYSLNGHFFQDYNPGFLVNTATTVGSPWIQGSNQVPIPIQDFSYTVTGYGTNGLYFVVENNNLTPTTPNNPNAVVNLDLMANNMSTTAKSVPWTVTINVPSNASNVMFTLGTGVTLTSGSTTSGHTLVLSGTYSATTTKGAIPTTTPMLGVVQATLSNEFNAGSQFTMDTASINGVAVNGQSLYFGMGESNNAGAYSINNIPAGLLTITPFNNVAAINPRNISVNDALAVLSIAAGKGIPQGPGQAVASANLLLPSDFAAADFNMDGQVTAADALGILNYIVSVNKANLTPNYTYLPAASNTTLYTFLPAGASSSTATVKESVTAQVPPPLVAVASDKNGNATLFTGDSTKVIDIIGVLPGDVVNY